MANLKTKLSAAMLALIAAGASAPVLFDQFISEKEGNALVAVVDPGGVWSLCHGVTVINGKLVIKGQRATEEQCKQVNAIERDKALAWVDRNIKAPLTAPQKVGIASFCPYNIGPGNASPRRSTNESMPVTAKAPARRFAGGLKTVAAIAG
nr:putative endolysin R of prophage CP-933V [Raoultella sp. NCTC 9187]